MTIRVILNAARKLNVFFGSQSGTAQAIAFGLSMSARDRDFECDVKSLNDCEINRLDADGAGATVVVVSNFGVGEPPDNAKAFFDRLRTTNVRSSNSWFSARRVSFYRFLLAQIQSKHALCCIWSRKQHIWGQLSSKFSAFFFADNFLI